MTRSTGSVNHHLLTVCESIHPCWWSVVVDEGKSVAAQLPRHVLLTIIHAHVISKVDYCNSVLTSISHHLIDRLHSVPNTAIQLIFSVRKSEPITPLLHELHWLWVLERIHFRLCDLVYQCLQETVPPYLKESLYRTTEEYCPLPFEVSRHFLAAHPVHPTSNPWWLCIFYFLAGTRDIVISIVIWLAYLRIVYAFINCLWTPVVSAAVAQVRSIM